MIPVSKKQILLPIINYNFYVHAKIDSLVYELSTDKTKKIEASSTVQLY